MTHYSVLVAVAAVLSPSSLLAQGVAIRYKTLPADEIRERLDIYKTTNSGREQELQMLFAEAGCGGDSLTERPVKHSHDPNLICTLPGQSESSIVVGAHFDFVNRGQGVVDNWSGSSLLPSLYQSLKDSPRRHTIVFVAFADEEKGLVGSNFYVHPLSKDAVGEIRAMVNMDSLGAGPTEVEVTRGDKGLINALAAVAGSMHLPLNAMNVHSVGRSDSDSFQDRHVPTILIHSITNQTWPILHSRNDAISAIHFSDYYDTYRLVAAYLAYLDVTLDAPVGSQ